MFELKPMARAVYNALVEIGEQWRRDQWYRAHGG